MSFLKNFKILLHSNIIQLWFSFDFKAIICFMFPLERPDFMLKRKFESIIYDPCQALSNQWALNYHLKQYHEKVVSKDYNLSNVFLIGTCERK